jgi:hypothetical protein
MTSRVLTANHAASCCCTVVQHRFPGYRLYQCAVPGRQSVTTHASSTAKSWQPSCDSIGTTCPTRSSTHRCTPKRAQHPDRGANTRVATITVTKGLPFHHFTTRQGSALSPPTRASSMPAHQEAGCLRHHERVHRAQNLLLRALEPALVASLHRALQTRTQHKQVMC